MTLLLIRPSSLLALRPDLAITKTHSGNAQQGQTGFVYTIAVQNVGSAAHHRHA